MGRISSTLKLGALVGVLAFLSELLKLLHGQFVAGTPADDETKKGLATFVLWYPEIHQAADRTDTSIDNQVVNEVMQFAESVLPASFISEARGIYGPEDVATEEPEGEDGEEPPIE